MEASFSCNNTTGTENEPQHTTKDLCTCCASINFDALYNKKIEPRRLYPVQYLGYINETWQERSCPFCRFLFAIWNNCTNRIHDSEHVIGLMSTRNYNRYSPLKRTYLSLNATEEVAHESDGSLDQFHASVLVLSTKGGVVGSTELREWDLTRIGGLISASYYGLVFFDLKEGEQKDTVKGCRINPDSIDFTRIKSWLDHCDSHHNTTCQPNEHEALPQFQLWDCDTQKLVPSHFDQRYVALSYVWGPDKANIQGDAHKQTIQDAIVVTRQLGLRYIWIDRYCVPRNNEARHVQLSRMDLIYLNAFVTIVAAYGDRAESGLCGVSVPRPTQPRIRIGQHALISSFQNPSLYIGYSNKCQWSHRGWTYQEAMLSRRCLYFTQHQVYFECRAGTFQECIEDPKELTFPHDLSDDTKDAYESLPIGGTYRVFPSSSLVEIRHHPHLIFKRIYEYTYHRSLSFQKDALDAFLGILSRFHHPRFKISWIFGVPILWTSEDWTFQEGFAAGLCWETEAKSTRGTSFPTWSWIAWDGLIYGSDTHFFRGIKCPPGLNFTFETTAGDMIPWDKTREHFDRRCLSRFMHVESWVMFGTLVWTTKYGFSGSDEDIGYPHSYAVLSNRHGTIHVSASIPDSEAGNADKDAEGNLLGRDVSWDLGQENIETLEKIPCEILILGDLSVAKCNDSNRFREGSPGERAVPTRPFLIIIKDKGEYFERIGSISFGLTVYDSHGEALEDDADISWVFAEAKWRTIRLG